jgi:hypothetical protein
MFSPDCVFQTRRVGWKAESQSSWLQPVQCHGKGLGCVGGVHRSRKITYAAPWAILMQCQIGMSLGGSRGHFTWTWWLSLGLPSNPSRIARALNSGVHVTFSLLWLMLCYCVLKVSLCRSQRNGCVKVQATRS